MKHGISALTAVALISWAGFVAVAGSDRYGSGPEAAMNHDWDFYPCKVDDAPASIFLDLALLDYAQEASERTLNALRISMLQPGDHGMGEAAEADTLNPIEDFIVADAKTLGLIYVGRLRNTGVWQLTFMGTGDRTAELRDMASRHLESSGRSFDVIAREDPDWSYYRQFLYPDNEQMAWIQNRRVVDVLVQKGDSLASRRRVDHWILFPNKRAKDAFSEAVRANGFRIATDGVVGDDNLIRLQVYRVDSVRLEAIHAVTTELTALAAQQGGKYDGWETSVEE